MGGREEIRIPSLVVANEVAAQPSDQLLRPQFFTLRLSGGDHLDIQFGQQLLLIRIEHGFQNPRVPAKMFKHAIFML